MHGWRLLDIIKVVLGVGAVVVGIILAGVTDSLEVVSTAGNNPFKGLFCKDVQTGCNSIVKIYDVSLPGYAIDGVPLDSSLLAGYEATSNPTQIDTSSDAASGDAAAFIYFTPGYYQTQISPYTYPTMRHDAGQVGRDSKAYYYLQRYFSINNGTVTKDGQPLVYDNMPQHMVAATAKVEIISTDCVSHCLRFEEENTIDKFSRVTVVPGVVASLLILAIDILVAFRSVKGLLFWSPTLTHL